MDAQGFARRQAAALDRHLFMQLKADVHAALFLHPGDHRVQALTACVRSRLNFGIFGTQRIFLAHLEQRIQTVVSEMHLAVDIAPVKRAVVAQGFQLILSEIVDILLKDGEHIRLRQAVILRNLFSDNQLKAQAFVQRLRHTRILQPLADHTRHAVKVARFKQPLDIRRQRIAQIR